jgi:hypothetical protein
MTETRTLDLSEDASEHDYQVITDELTRALETVNPDSNTYKANGENVGWRNTNGETTVELTSGEDLLQQLAPNSPCRMEFKISDTAITVTLFHHDSPTGETHTITNPQAS